MEYGRLVSRAFEIAWRYKSLWVFWIVAAASVAHYNIPFGGTGGWVGGEGLGMASYDLGDPMLLTAMIFFVSWLIFGVVFHIATGALVDAVNRIERGGIYRFTDALSAGLHFFWRVVGLSLVPVVGLSIVFGIATVLVVFAFAINFAAGIILVLVLSPVALGVIFAFTTIVSLGIRALVVRDMSIGDAWSEGYALFSRNKASSLIVFLISVGFGLAWVIIYWTVALVVAVPFAGLSLVSGGDGLGSLFATVLITLPFYLLFNSFASVVQYTLYTLFYFELVEPKYSVAAEIPPPAAAPLA